MRRFSPVLILTICISLGAAANETNIFVGGWLPPHAIRQLDFFVSASQLSSNQAWKITEPFPLRLDAEARKANLFIATQKQITNRIDLGEVTIRRKILRTGSGPLEGAGDTSERWIVALRHVIPEAPQTQQYEYVVMLLDGSYAMEKANSTVGVERLSAFSEAARKKSSLQQPETPRSDKLSRLEILYQQISRTDLIVPQVQWDPNAAPFPMDIGFQAGRAKEYLAKALGIAADSLEINEILFQNYIPLEAIQAQGLSVMRNRWHWQGHFDCTQQVEEGTTHYTVCMLLDGRILGAGRSYFKAK